jgi:hypothetical protein
MAGAGISCWPKGARRIELSGLTLDGANQRLGGHVSGLVHLRGVSEAVLEDMAIAGADGHGVTLEACGGRIHHCEIFRRAAGGDLRD